MKRARWIALFLAVVLGVAAAPPPGRCAEEFLKNYLIRRDRGRDVLCDPYVVQKNEWVLLLFRRRGEISEKDFPTFLDLFKRLNPDVKDINLVRPGQRIMIPLKILEPGDMAGQETGAVTIPLLTISNAPRLIRSRSSSYVVQRGDCVSILIARRFGDFGGASYKKGVALFRFLNPRVKDLSRIYPGQTLQLPMADIRDQPWFSSLFDAAGNLTPDKTIDEEAPPEAPPAPVVPPPPTPPPPPETPVEAAAEAVEARLLSRGSFFFPMEGQADYALDLARYPVMEMEGIGRILLIPENEVDAPDLSAVKSHWPDLHVVRTRPGATTGEILRSVMKGFTPADVNAPLTLREGCLSFTVRAGWVLPPTGERSETVCVTFLENEGERTHPAVRGFLETKGVLLQEWTDGGRFGAGRGQGPGEGPGGPDRPPVLRIDAGDARAMTAALIRALGYNYAENTGIRFPYSGMMVHALTNMVFTGRGKDLLVDFGDFQGEAVAAIEQTGIGVLVLDPSAPAAETVAKLLAALGEKWIDPPVFRAARRERESAVEVTLPGMLVERETGRDLLISPCDTPERLKRFFDDADLRLVVLEGAGGFE